jgi:hypothetical protein
MIRLDYRRVTNGTNVWHVTGRIHKGGVSIETIHGDVTDMDGLRDAVARLIESKPRYRRLAGLPKV